MPTNMKERLRRIRNNYIYETGLKKGIEKGRSLEISENNKRIARNMLSQDISIEIIIYVTGFYLQILFLDIFSILFIL